MKNVDKFKCTTRELKVLGDFWTLAIIQELQDGSKRFVELEKGQKVNPTTLSNRLKKLEGLKLVTRRGDDDNKVCIYYSLTEKGQGILPVLRQIKLFSEKYL